jgi:thymidylate kinase
MELAEQGGWTLIDCTQSIEDVHQEILKTLKQCD